MTPTTRRAAATQGNTGNKGPPQGSQRESARGSGRRSRGVRTSNVARADEEHPPSAAERNVVQPLSTADTSHDRGSDWLQQVAPAPTNLIRNTPFGEPIPQFQRPAPPQPSPNPTDPSVRQARPPPNPPYSHQPRCPPHHSTKHAKPPRTRPRRYESRPKNLSKIGLKKAMELHTTEERRSAYNQFRVSGLLNPLPITNYQLPQEHVRFAMKQCGEGVWIDFDNVPKRFSDWLVDEVRNNPRIPFMDEYGRWAVLDAARGTAGSWRKDLYRRRLREVPENRRYLAANSSKRNPNAPRGARFPARSSKRNRTPAPDHNNHDGNGNDSDDHDHGEDERIPVLPPGPSTTTDSVGFTSHGGPYWDPAPPSNYPTHLASSAPQLPFDDSVQPSPFPYNPLNFPLSDASSSMQHWANPPLLPPISGYPQMQNEHRDPQRQQDTASRVSNQAPPQPFSPGGVGHGILPGYPSMWNAPTPWPYGQQLNANAAVNQHQAEYDSRLLPPAWQYLNTNGRRHQGSGAMNRDDNSDDNCDDEDRHGYGYADDDDNDENNDGLGNSDDGSNPHQRRRGQSSPPGG
ncbi:hypothetical protein BJ322DRAFT_1019237 [Thelephora terrestris]|uniref:Uncharacterized protein n=1 Tax=Thelephora terrestris TaxID=56493 RepID=A0A9P6L981_9AGAM|nr:hypothetical protein BJ322DRAFT_1019237 [Thelephora terrestris]